MPALDFQAEDGHIITVLVGVNEPSEARHVQRVVDPTTGIEKVYKRVYSAPLAAKDMLQKDATKEDFKRVTEGKNMTVGEMWEISREMSEQRASKNAGHDPVKENFYKEYEKKTGGKHIDVKKRDAMEKAQKTLENMGIRVK